MLLLKFKFLLVYFLIYMFTTLLLLRLEKRFKEMKGFNWFYCKPEGVTSGALFFLEALKDYFSRLEPLLLGSSLIIIERLLLEARAIITGL
jgi:hypothetical protein